jgi:hypothetical protein
MRWRLLCLLLAVGCPAPGLYMVELPGESCGRATRLAYRSMARLGYRVTGVVEASPVAPGKVEGVKKNADGTEKRAQVRVACDAGGARLQPVEGALVPTDYDFSRNFGYSVQTLAKQPDVAGPSDGHGLEVLLERIDEPRARLDLGGPVLAQDAVLLRVTVRNHTDGAVVVDPARVTLVTAAGDMESAEHGDALRASLGAGKAAEEVRRRLLARLRVPAGQTVERYLVFPLAAYVDGQVSIEDAETGESDGFVVPVQ